MSTTTTSETTIRESIARAQSAIKSLSAVLGPLPDSLTYSANPSLSLLHDPDVAGQISARLRRPDSGVGDDDVCRWLYDTFQSMDPELQLTVLRFVPTIAGMYLSRTLSRSRKPLAGFEAVLLALYAHETVSRGGEPLTVRIPDLCHPSLYHETKNPINNRAVELHLAVLSPALEPHGTVRSTKRARIVGVALELYYSKICQMPVSSKVDFCEFCVAWAGRDGCEEMEGTSSSKSIGGIIGGEDGPEDHDSDCGGSRCKEESGEMGRRIPLPWELFQPALRIVGHCLLSPSDSDELKEKVSVAVRCLYTRAMHDMIPQAMLATRSLLRLEEKMAVDSNRKSSDLEGLDDLRDAGHIDDPYLIF